MLVLIEPFVNKEVLEIGGPSPIFRKKGLIPLYPIVKNLDNVNFSYKTIWENDIEEGNSFKYDNRSGFQYIMEASNLHLIKNEQYEGLFSSHCLEHTGNPIKVLFEWKRIIKIGGHILLVLPDKLHTFDHRRPYTTFEHLINDYENKVNEDDLTHLDEILQLHDKNKDDGLQNIDLKTRSLENFKNRCLHHHVFNDSIIKKMCDFAGFELLEHNKFYPYHLVYLLKKVSK